MKKKRRYFSVVAVILLLTSNTSASVQAIEKELFQNNSSVEKIDAPYDGKSKEVIASEDTEKK
ncbi:hypothetical protein N568_0108725 [Lactococcus garvieae TRF1]|uniref:Uncharacterized protein n=1 Tax=Lactococcus garvieae TRF1 TaxID=1380772 RepID=V8AMS2_9LACT|nr:hypothetical protein N568_0108725 [Lactococcus garvieae TRF1]